MRTFEEICTDAERAFRINDAALLIDHAVELQGLDTSHAVALAHFYRGSALNLRSDFPSALECFERSLALFEDLGQRLGAARAMSGIATVNTSTGDYQAALEHFNRALAILEELGDRSEMARTTNGIGEVYLATGEYQAALEHFHRARTLFQELGDRPGETRATSVIGNVYFYTGDNSAALEHYRQVLALQEELGDRPGVASALANISNVYNATGDYPSSLEYNLRALALFEELGARRGAAVVTGNIGTMHYYSGDYPLALEHYHRALVLRGELGDRPGVARTTNGIGNVYFATGDFPAALEHFRRALALQEDLGDRQGVATAAHDIGNVYAQTGDYPLALDYYRRALVLHEDLGNRQGVATCQVRVLDVYVNMGDDAEALAMLQSIDQLQIDDPAARVERDLQRATLQERSGNIEAAIETLHATLTEALDYTLRPAAAHTHLRLREIAITSNDFPKYIEHNNEYSRISEEIRGQQAALRLAMFETDRRMEAERRERERERALLYGALPRSVADRMIRGEIVKGDHFPDAAVFFADVAGFTSGSSALEASQVVRMLAQVFDAFDRICDEHAVIKVKTIGDSYMCFKGDAAADENVAALARVALDVNRSTFTWPDGSPICFRIGMHVGPVTAGVIGTQRLQYDVWGDTINIASRMESSGEPGRIHVSELFAQRVSNFAGNLCAPSVVCRGVMEVVDIGPMTTYWLGDR